MTPTRPIEMSKPVLAVSNSPVSTRENVEVALQQLNHRRDKADEDEGDPDSIEHDRRGRPHSAWRRANSASGNCTRSGARAPSSHRAMSRMCARAMAVQPAVGVAGDSHTCRKMHEPAPGTGGALLWATTAPSS
jgi:hypothetical protein